MRKSRGPRRPADPALERQRIEERSVEQWIDEGSLRDAAQTAVGRARPAGGSGRRDATLDPTVVAEIHGVADPRRAAHLSERLAAAAAALDRERFDDARRMAAAVVRELPQIAAGHEIVGLALYRSHRWQQAAAALEQARLLHPDPALLPVLADCYRALRRWNEVEAIWRDVREDSPSHEVMTEARIVVAGALADRGELRQAIELLDTATKAPKRVREHHLRQWYVLADLLDRAGDTIGAARWFNDVVAHDADFADARQRLRALGR